VPIFAFLVREQILRLAGLHGHATIALRPRELRVNLPTILQAAAGFQLNQLYS
jgi:hypothetical protein